MRLKYLAVAVLTVFTTTLAIGAEVATEGLTKNISMKNGSFVAEEPSSDIYSNYDNNSVGEPTAVGNTKTMVQENVKQSERRELASRNSQSETCECRCGYFPCKGGGYQTCPGGPVVPPVR
jgi:hypothetical protein